MINFVLTNNYNKNRIQTNDEQNVSNQLKSIYKMNNVQKWVNSILLKINENTEIVFSNQDEVDEHITQDSMTCVQDCIVINIPREINNNELSTNNKNQNCLENCNIINYNVTSEVNMCTSTNDYNINNNIIINEANSINNSCPTMEVEVLEEANNYDNTQIGVRAYKKLSRGHLKKKSNISGKIY